MPATAARSTEGRQAKVSHRKATPTRTEPTPAPDPGRSSTERVYEFIRSATKAQALTDITSTLKLDPTLAQLITANLVIAKRVDRCLIARGTDDGDQIGYYVGPLCRRPEG
jgi:hypothetical protein